MNERVGQVVENFAIRYNAVGFPAANSVFTRLALDPEMAFLTVWPACHIFADSSGIVPSPNGWGIDGEFNFYRSGVKIFTLPVSNWSNSIATNAKLHWLSDPTFVSGSQAPALIFGGGGLGTVLDSVCLPAFRFNFIADNLELFIKRHDTTIISNSLFGIYGMRVMQQRYPI